jgi:F0F1-type ATP synthase assembly protein I
MVVWGGIGWLLDLWLHIRVLAPVGIILGMAVAIYLVVVRYGAVEPPQATRPGRTSGGRRSRPRTQKGQR